MRLSLLSCRSQRSFSRDRIPSYFTIHVILKADIWNVSELEEGLEDEALQFI